MASKSKVDKAGRILSDTTREYDETTLEMEFIFDDFRIEHLTPLTELTLHLQEWLQTYEKDYYIAQRLKRRPQILRKLRRYSVRLSQLQDIGGCRIVVEKNTDVDDLKQSLRDLFSKSEKNSVLKETDYRELGRDDSGYRAFHLVVEAGGRKLELQIRSQLQHYWSESIERTSVMYGHRLKEQEGDPQVIKYFKSFSDALHTIESKQKFSNALELELEEQRKLAEAIITAATKGIDLGGYVNTGIIKTMTEKEAKSRGRLNNWILVFDWKDGNFVTWDMIGRDPKEASEMYSKYEREFPEEEKYEVVMIGSSDISSVRQTHSHYFGIEHHNSALESMEKSIIGLTSRMSMDVGARRILSVLKRRGYWEDKKVAVSTLKNHFCQNVATFDDSLQELQKEGLIVGKDPISLNIRKSAEINRVT